MSEEWDVVETGESVSAGVGVRTSSRLGKFHTSFAVHVDCERSAKGRGLKIQCEIFLDTSGSMQGAGIRGLKEVVRTLAHVAETQLTQNEFAGSISTFASGATVMPETPEPELLATLRASKTDAISARLFASGGTNVDEALKLGSRRMRDFSRKFDASILVIATDGQPTMGAIFDASELRARFDAERQDMRHYIVPLAMGLAPSQSFLSTLASNETFVSVASDIEAVPDALFSALRLFNDALALFDVSLEVVRGGRVVFEATLNKGFVTSRREVVSFEVEFAFEPGDVVSVTYPGGQDAVTLAEDMETRADIWKELDTIGQFEAEIEKIRVGTASMGFKAAAVAVRQFSEALPADVRTRSLNERAQAVYRSLSLASELPVVKRAYEDTSATRYRSLCGGGAGVDGESDEETTLRSIARGGSAPQRAHPPRGSELIWKACLSQSAF
jgi:uncharacterized protein YegL